MAKYAGPVCRLCRREAAKLFLKGSKCYTPKCPMEKRAYPPGEHGQGRHKTSEYGAQLREKQKARRAYGVLERQFRRYFTHAARARGVTGETLLQLLERRLDNVVFRLGFAGSRLEARQLVGHGHFTVNGRRVDVPSFQVRPNDVVALAERSKGLARFKQIAEQSLQRTIPTWLELDAEKARGQVLRLPTREEIDVPVQEHQIIALYSK